MPEKDGKRETQHTGTGYEIPVPKRGEVMDLFDKAAKKRRPRGEVPRSRSRRKPSEPS
jgi:hypothetical protein